VPLRIDDLAHLGGSQNFECDLLIIGGGPAGLTIAREFFDHSTRVLVLESGLLEEEPQFDALNTLESIGEPKSVAQISRRVRFHSTSSGLWSHSSQPYGVRCRALGGSSWAWAGKSAAFDEIDFEYRPWVPYSGWPITRAALGSYIDRAAERLNLGPTIFDDRLWELIGGPAPEPPLDPKVLRSFFWQFARSRVDQMNFVRFGPEFVRENTPNVRVLLNATVTKILTNAEGLAIKGVEVSSLDGVRAHVQAKVIVLAANACC
jgi:choline dehydrogenase-like flavoprotein